ncbi:MAG: glycogen-binding domain-containing protein [Fibrobacteraceae bacterium]|nr:glycogen-binding domain-containing protein [Fibrobacteraceae bacterium]
MSTKKKTKESTATPKAAPKDNCAKSEAKSAKKASLDVVFNVYSPDSTSVEVAGEFNSWTPEKMKKGNDGVWTLKKALAAGSYQYKFVFDGSWEIDQANPDRVPDGQGGENSVKNV